jgi:hypothetical protein
MKARANEMKAPSVIHVALPYATGVDSRYLFRAMLKRTISMIQTTKVVSNAIVDVMVIKTVPKRW